MDFDAAILVHVPQGFVGYLNPATWDARDTIERITLTLPSGQHILLRPQQLIERTGQVWLASAVADATAEEMHHSAEALPPTTPAKIVATPVAAEAMTRNVMKVAPADRSTETYKDHDRTTPFVIDATPHPRASSAAQTLPDNARPAQTPPPDVAPRSATPHDQSVVVPVVEEEAEIGKRIVHNTVRINKTAHVRQETADVSLKQERVEVERVAVNRVIDAPAVSRQEGNTLVIPVMEEVLVVEKRLILREEVRLTTVRSDRAERRTVDLCYEKLDITRLPAEPGGTATHDDASGTAPHLNSAQ